MLRNQWELNGPWKFWPVVPQEGCQDAHLLHQLVTPGSEVVSTWMELGSHILPLPSIRFNIIEMVDWWFRSGSYRFQSTGGFYRRPRKKLPKRLIPKQSLFCCFALTNIKCLKEQAKSWKTSLDLNQQETSWRSAPSPVSSATGDTFWNDVRL